MKNIAPVTVALLFISTTCFAQTIEQLNERIRILEEKVRRLESFHNIQSNTQKSTTAVQQSTSSYTPVSKTTTPVSSAYKKVSADNGEMAKIIRARLFKKNMVSGADGKKITMLIALTNTSRININAFKGTVVLSDYTGEDLVSFSLDLAKPITSYDSESWFGEIPHRPADPGYVKFLSLKAEDIRTRLECEEIVFADGTVKKAGR